MRTIIALAFLASLSLAAGCCGAPAPPVQRAYVPDTLTPTQPAPGCHYAYANPQEVRGDDPSCTLATFEHGFTLDTAQGYDIALTVPEPLSTSTATEIGPSAHLVFAGFPCSEWIGLVSWVGGTSWSVDVKAECVDDGTLLEAFFNGVQ